MEHKQKNTFQKTILMAIHRGKTKIWEYLDDDKMNRAFLNAQAIRKSKRIEIQTGEAEWNFNPYTTIDKLVKVILKRK